MSNKTKCSASVVKGFDIGHSQYIETATGTDHMYFLLGTETRTINKGMRCKDFLQEVYLAKRFKRNKTGNQIYGFSLRGIRNATKLYLKFPRKNMYDYKDNIHRCIKYINKAYDISISVCVFDEYVELTMPLNWFTDKINPVQASAISSLLRSCMIWEYDTYTEMLENIEDIEDEYESIHIFPEKDWTGRSDAALDFLGNLKAQRVLGSWELVSKNYKIISDTTYHNNSGWCSCFNFYRNNNITDDMLDLLDTMSPSSISSDQCILINSKRGKLLYPKIIRNSKDLTKALKGMTDVDRASPSLLFNNSILNTTNKWQYDIQFANPMGANLCEQGSLQYYIAGLGPISSSKGGIDRVVKQYEIIRLRRVINALSYETCFSLNATPEKLRFMATDVPYCTFKKKVMNSIHSSKVKLFLNRRSILKDIHNLYNNV